MKKKGFLLASSVGAAALAPASGQAADMAPILKAPPAPAPVAASWTGFYIGGHAGAAWQQASTTGNTLVEVYTTGQRAVGYGAGTTTHHSTSFIGGGQAGYNWQSGNFVFGLEADGSWLSKGSGSSFTTIQGYQTSGRIDWLATARVRFGLAVGNTMAYVTGGVAFGGVKNCKYCDFSHPKSESTTRVGWTVGFGVEHMLTRNWTIGIEGLFVDLGNKVVQASSNEPFKATRFSNQAVIGRLKLNYKF